MTLWKQGFSLLTPSDWNTNPFPAMNAAQSLVQTTASVDRGAPFSYHPLLQLLGVRESNMVYGKGIWFMHMP